VPSEPAPSPRLLIDAREARRLLTIGERSLWRLVAIDAIPHRRIGRCIRFQPAEIAAWISCGCPATPGAAERVRQAVRR
jgi:predicted DNA-binding transcriptional regulator AlpA